MSSPANPLPPEDLAHVLAHTRELWAGARGQSFFITGGTGFFGVWLLESFAHANDTLQLGMRAVVLTRDPAAFSKKAPHLAARADMTFHQGDLRTFVFPQGQFDHLVHAAADTRVWTQALAAEGLLDEIVGGVRRVLDFAAAAGVRNFLLVSSGAVYGPQPAALTHVPEDHLGGPDPLLPSSAWAEGKRVAEQLCAVHAIRHGYALKVARCFVFVGPHLPLDASYAIGNFIWDGLRGEPIRVNGDGTPRRSYLYASDLAAWLWTILFSGRPSRPYNVGSADDLSIAELAALVQGAFPQSGPIKVMRAVETGRPVSRYVPAVSRAATELGLDAWVPLKEAIRKTVAWYSAPTLAASR